MRRLAWYSSFRRAFRRRTKNNQSLRERIFETLEKLSQNPLNPQLKTHKLRGQLEGLWACTVDYDLRIIFTFEPDPITNEEIIVLIDIGSHEEVY
ncbi:MAG: type II toxin-antitoxin system YafQ family toxin [Anaerolineales bacterium]